MGSEYPYLFPTIPALHQTTLLHTQRRRIDLAPGEWSFDIDMLVNFLEAQYKIYRVRGIYNSDASAATAGVQIGQLYECAAGHLDGLPEGTLKIRRQ